MASDGGSSDNLPDQISHLALGLPGSKNESETTKLDSVFESTQADNFAAESQNKDLDLASQLQDITHERDLYEKKLKALNLVMISMDNEIVCLERNNFFLAEKLASLHAAMENVLPTMVNLLERCLPAGLWPNCRSLFDGLSKALEDLMEA